MTSLPKFDWPADVPPATPALLGELSAALQSTGIVCLVPRDGEPLGARFVHALLTHAAHASGLEVLHLRADTEVALQCDLVRLARNQGLPEQHVRASSHPRHGLARRLVAQPQVVIWLEGLRSAAEIEELLPLVADRRVVVSCNSESIPAELNPRLTLMLPPLDPDGSRSWLATRVASDGRLSAERVPVDILRCPAALSALLWMDRAIEMRSLAPSGPPRLALLADQWWQAEHAALPGWLMALWTCSDRRICSETTLLAAAAQVKKWSPLELAAGWEKLTAGCQSTSSPTQVIELPAEWYAALADAVPAPLRLQAVEALGKRRVRVDGDSLADEVALAADRFATLAVAVPELASDLRENCLRDAALAVRAVGACRQGALHAQRLVQLVSQRLGDRAVETAEAWRLVADVQQFGNQLLAARKSARHAEEILELHGARTVQRLAEVKCLIAELDLAEGRSERAHHRLEQVRGLLQGTHPTVVVTGRWMFLQGACLLAGKQLDRSEVLLRRSLAMREQFLSADDPELLTTRMLLARNLFALQRTEEAEAWLQDDLRIRRESPAVTPEETAVAANLLADLYFASGRYAAAEPLLEEVLDVRRQIACSHERYVSEAACRLASLKASRGDYAAADRLFRLALSITEATFGEHHPRVADVLNELAKMLFTQSRHDQSRRLLERALQIQQRAYRKEDPRIIESRNNLAAIYVARGHYDYAAQLYSESLQAARKWRQGDHPTLATTLNNLGDVYRSLGRYREAEEMLVESLAMRSRLYGPDHPILAQSLSNVAYLRLLLGRSADALADVERALAIRRQTLGEHHPHTANSLMTLGRLHWRRGDKTAALTAFAESSTILRQVLGDRSQQYGSSLALWGRAELAVGSAAKAELHLLKSRLILEDTVGANHRLYTDALLGLAELAEAEGRFIEAFPLLERALVIQRQTLGPDRFEIGETLLSIGRNLLHRGVSYVAADRLLEAETLLLSLAEPPHWIVVQVAIETARTALNNRNLELAEQKIRLGIKWLDADDDSDARAELQSLQAAAAIQQEHYEPAQRLLRSLIERAERRAGPDAPELIPLLDQLAATFTLQGRAAEAETYVRRSLTLAEQHHGRRHLAVAERMDHLASILMRTNRLAEAQTLLDEVVAIREDKGVSDPQPLVNALQRQADLLHMLKRSNDAIVIEQRAASLQNRTSHVLEDIL